MNVASRAVLPLILLVQLCFAAADQVYSIKVPATAEGRFNVIDGVPCLLRKDESGPAGNALDITRDGRLIHYGTKQSLSYPVDGDNPVITLGPAHGRADVWKAPSGEKKASITATKGKFAGWYLDWRDEEEEITVKDKVYHVRRLILVEKPAKAKVFESYPVSK